MMNTSDKLFILEVQITSLKARLQGSSQYAYNVEMQIETGLLQRQILALETMMSILKR
jgi:hypothetical protein